MLPIPEAKSFFTLFCCSLALEHRLASSYNSYSYSDHLSVDTTVAAYRQVRRESVEITIQIKENLGNKSTLCSMYSLTISNQALSHSSTSVVYPPLNT